MPGNGYKRTLLEGADYGRFQTVSGLFLPQSGHDRDQQH